MVFFIVAIINSGQRPRRIDNSSGTVLHSTFFTFHIPWLHISHSLTYLEYGTGGIATRWCLCWAHSGTPCLCSAHSGTPPSNWLHFTFLVFLQEPAQTLSVFLVKMMALEPSAYWLPHNNKKGRSNTNVWLSSNNIIFLQGIYYGKHVISHLPSELQVKLEMKEYVPDEIVCYNRSNWQWCNQAGEVLQLFSWHYLVFMYTCHCVLFTTFFSCTCHCALLEWRREKNVFRHACKCYMQVF